MERNSLVINNSVDLGEDLTAEANGKGRKFVSRFIEAGLAHYEQFGDVLITKETLDKFIQTMVGCPVIIKHKDITDQNADKERVGVISRVWYDQNDGWFYCEGVIWNKQAIDLVKNQGWSVSCTYDFESDFKKGSYHGKQYDMEFTNGEFLHLALVPNPRYERANIVMNSKDIDKETMFLEGLRDILANHKHYSESDLRVVNELSRIFNETVDNDRWITVKPNGEDNKGRHLLLKDGETPKEAIERIYEQDNKIKSKLEQYIERSKKKAKNPKFFDGFKVKVNKGIVQVEKNGITSKAAFKYDSDALDGKGNDWNEGALGNLIGKWNAQNCEDENSLGE